MAENKNKLIFRVIIFTLLLNAELKSDHGYFAQNNSSYSFAKISELFRLRQKLVLRQFILTIMVKIIYIRNYFSKID